MPWLFFFPLPFKPENTCRWISFFFSTTFQRPGFMYFRKEKNLKAIHLFRCTSVQLYPHFTLWAQCEVKAKSSQVHKRLRKESIDYIKTWKRGDAYSWQAVVMLDLPFLVSKDKECGSWGCSLKGEGSKCWLVSRQGYKEWLSSPVWYKVAAGNDMLPKWEVCQCHIPLLKLYFTNTQSHFKLPLLSHTI